MVPINNKPQSNCLNLSLEKVFHLNKVTSRLSTSEKNHFLKMMDL